MQPHQVLRVDKGVPVAVVLARRVTVVRPPGDGHATAVPPSFSRLVTAVSPPSFSRLVTAVSPPCTAGVPVATHPDRRAVVARHVRHTRPAAPLEHLCRRVHEVRAAPRRGRAGPAVGAGLPAPRGPRREQAAEGPHLARPRRLSRAAGLVAVRVRKLRVEPRPIRQNWELRQVSLTLISGSAHCLLSRLKSHTVGILYVASRKCHLTEGEI